MGLLPSVSVRPQPKDHLDRKRKAPVVERLACWSARRRKTAVFLWLAFVAGAFIAGQFVTSPGAQQYDPGQAGQGERVLTQLGVVTPPAESVLIEARAGARHLEAQAAAKVKNAADEVFRALASAPSAAANVRGPYEQNGPALWSRHGIAALVTFDVAGPAAAADATVLRDVSMVHRVQAAHPGLIVSEAGAATTDRAANSMLGQDFRQSEWTSIPLTLILLLVVFGALIAAGIPVLLAGTAVVAAVSLLGIAAQWLPVGSGASEIVLVIGMAVGVDYSLFYLRREREERAAGSHGMAALKTAAATSGRAIVVSGLTVMVSLAGMFLTGMDVFTGLAFGTIMVVGVTVLGSLTFLPALLSWLGPWADRGRLPYLGRRRTRPRSSRLWVNLAKRVVRKPLLYGGIATAGMLALSAPALGMRIGSPSIDLPSNMSVVRVLDDIQHHFPGKPAPAEVVVTGSKLDGAAMAHAIGQLRSKASPSGPIRGPITAAPVAHGKALVLQVPLAGNGSDKASKDALVTLQDEVLPATIGHVPNTNFAVTGDTASGYDFQHTLDTRTPLVFFGVALLAFVLLMAAFRSIAVPLVSIGLNLLSVGGAYGVVTLIFQDGHLQSLLGFTSFGALVPWIPLFTFVLLFGLSMDYHVFILSRIKELRAGGATCANSIVDGIGSSAGVVTSAAVIMVAVFSIFASLSLIDVKMLGVGLAVAVLIDATVVRGIVLPASLALLGERARYLPSWLAWLPGRSLACEGTVEQAAPVAAPEKKLVLVG